MNELPKRINNRLVEFDYSQNGAYFVTICTKDRECILSEVVGGGVLDAPQMQLTKYGIIVDNQIKEINDTYTNLNIDKYVIMPNHVHLIVVVCHENGTSRTPSPTNAVIPRFVSTLKRFTNKKCGFNLWQRSFHDHIIRNQPDYDRIWQYIDENPIKWELDKYYVE